MILISVKRTLTCVNSSEMNAIFDIPYNFRLSVKLSTHMINSARTKIEFGCTNYFRSIVTLVFAVTIALSKFRFIPLESK